MTDTLQRGSARWEDRVKVWDPVVRVFHWSLVTVFAVAYFTGDEAETVHEWAGYAALALIALRLVWGVIGTRHARFTEFVPRPTELKNYARQVLRGRERRYMGHNPAAAIMILFLLLATTVIGVSGWLLTTDWGWSSELLEDLHEGAVNITLLAIALHVGAAIYESIHHRENLIRSMFTGYKRAGK